MTIEATVSRAIWSTSQPLQTGSSDGTGVGNSGNEGAPGSGHGFWKEDTGWDISNLHENDEVVQRAIENLNRRGRGEMPRRSQRKARDFHVDHAVERFFSAFLPKYCANACPV